MSQSSFLSRWTGRPEVGNDPSARPDRSLADQPRPLAQFLEDEQRAIEPVFRDLEEKLEPLGRYLKEQQKLLEARLLEQTRQADLRLQESLKLLPREQEDPRPHRLEAASWTPLGTFPILRPRVNV
jgi:hypothetical protein